MGRRSREARQRRTRSQKRSGREAELENELKRLHDGDLVYWASKGLPPEIRESNLEDIIAFESVETGTSLFEGLQQHGTELPPPEKLDELQSIEKVGEVLRALSSLRILLVGFEHMTAREFYWTLWNQTLWEACYIEKRNPGALTIIDVSHQLSRSDILQLLEGLKEPESVQ